MEVQVLDFIKKEKYDMECIIRQSIISAIDDFHRATGLKAESILITMPVEVKTEKGDVIYTEPLRLEVKVNF